MLNPAKKNARKRRAVDRLLCRRVPGLSRTLAFELICIHINGWHWMKERVYICAIQRGRVGVVWTKAIAKHTLVLGRRAGNEGGGGIEGNAGPGMRHAHMMRDTKRLLGTTHTQDTPAISSYTPCTTAHRTPHTAHRTPHTAHILRRTPHTFYTAHRTPLA